MTFHEGCGKQKNCFNSAFLNPFKIHYVVCLACLMIFYHHDLEKIVGYDKEKIKSEKLTSKSLKSFFYSVCAKS